MDNPISFTEAKCAINKPKKGKASPKKQSTVTYTTSLRAKLITNKWRGIMLMDMFSKVFLSVMTAQAFALLDKHGRRFHYGGTPEIGCRDGLFTVKALLNARHNHDLASYVGFVNLVKEYDTANHTLLIDILHKYGAPPKLVPAIKTIYRYKICVLKIENKHSEIPQTVGVRQGNIMALVLFLILMTAFAETLGFMWKEQDHCRWAHGREENLQPHTGDV
jgi:hypothetical protein